jgi:phage terminase large subunit-like protein
LYIAKERAGVAKIDPLIAMLNAVQMLELGPVASGSQQSVYETRGLLII